MWKARLAWVRNRNQEYGIGCTQQPTPPLRLRYFIPALDVKYCGNTCRRKSESGWKKQQNYLLFIGFEEWQFLIRNLREKRLIETWKRPREINFDTKPLKYRSTTARHLCRYQLHTSGDRAKEYAVEFYFTSLSCFSFSNEVGRGEWD